MNDAPDTLMSLFFFDQASMSRDQVESLSEWIRQDPQNARAFIRDAMLHRSIHEALVRSDTTEDMAFFLDSQDYEDVEQALNPEIWRLLSENEKTAPSVELPEPAKPPVMMSKAKVERPPQKINRFSIVSAIVALAALLFLIVYVHIVPVHVHEEVATLIDTVDAQWAESTAAVKKGARVSTNTEPLMLRKGIAKLLFDKGIKVLIEAPSEFVLITGDQVKLNYGRLYAVVPQQAIGFTVTTPNSKIIDLGTEFGVQVDFEESTQLYVLKGKTTLVADQEGRKVSLQVNEGSAKSISNQSQEVADIDCDKELFVRDIESGRNLIWRGGPLELADMLDGGSGSNGAKTGFPERRMGPGQPVVLMTPELDLGDYFAVEMNPFIDGLFVPNGVNGPVSITQDGQLLWNAPDMEVRQKIGYLRFDISGIGKNRTAAVLSLDIRRRAGEKREVQVYGLRDGQADWWDETQVTYNTAAGLLPAPIGKFRLDQQVLENLGTISFNGVGQQHSDPSTLTLDEFIAQDTNGLLTFVLVRQQSDLSSEWMIRPKEDESGRPPTLTFPYGKNGSPIEITTAFGRGADTYLSNDNQYDDTGPDTNHGSETVVKIRNYVKNPCTVTNAANAMLSDDAFSQLHPFMLDGQKYIAQANPILAMRINTGITFDLQKIRSYYNGILDLKSFTAVCGPAEVTQDYIAARQWRMKPKAGFYVLVDGQERFSKKDMTAGDAACPITVLLTPQDRYLTLVTTGVSDRLVPRDWGLFVNPRINVE